MILHYLTVALRVFSRSKAYSLINVLGLTLGISCSIVIFLFVYDELTYDRHHSNIKNIYRLHGGWRSSSDGTSQMYAGVGYNEGDVLKRDFREIDQVIRLRRFWDARIEKPGSDEQFLEFVYMSEPNVFDVFTLPLIAGDPRSALADEKSLVISKKIALKYFNSTDVLGQSLRWMAQDTVDFMITGILEDHPDNTHLKIDFLTRFKAPSNLREQWFEYGYYTYFTLHAGSDISAVESKIKYFTKKDVDDVEKEIGFVAEHAIIPMSDIHLHSNLPGELERNSKASYVYIFLVVGIFILAMACINFMNLSTARSMVRAKEIGIRKVIGAVRRQLIRQFIGEALLMTLIATILSVAVANAMLPIVNEFTGKNLTIYSREFWCALAILTIGVTLLAGFYPAFFLSAFRPVETLKGAFKFSDRGTFLRKSLVIFQFTISIGLIAGVLIIWDHIEFMRNKDLGFNKEQVLVVNVANPVVKQEVEKLAGVTEVTISNRVPGNSVGGRTIIKGWNKTDMQVVLGQLAVDYDFIDFYDLKLLAGRGFDKNFSTDLKEAFVINESAMKLLGFNTPDQAIGQKLWLEEWGDHKGTIVGVLKDFHFIGVNSAIEPFSMFLHDAGNRFMSVRISGDIQKTIQSVEAIYQKHMTGRPFQYSFLDESFDAQYGTEERFMTIFTIFAGLAIAIASLGLYGLATFMAEQRTKEVGIRKILGASMVNILTLLTRDFLKLIVFAFVVAVPLAYYGMDEWLTTFPYREQIDPKLFLLTGFTVVGLTIAVISYKALHAAMINPVKTLRSE